jgi:hypothetical protein
MGEGDGPWGGLDPSPSNNAGKRAEEVPRPRRPARDRPLPILECLC